jgi:electron transport complex protein RnfG
MREIIRLVVVLSLICGVAAAALTGVRYSLETRIERQSDFYVRGPALERLFNQPAAELLGNKIRFAADGSEYSVFYTGSGDDVTGLAIEAPGAGGYGGDVIIMVALDLATGLMTGIEIIQHSETPGVGSRVEKAGFRKQWSGLSAAEPVKLRSQGGQIDAISGATYSSRAVIDGTNKIVQLLSGHRDDIIATIKSNGNGE